MASSVYRGLTRSERRWLMAHQRRLPKMSRGKRRLVYCSDARLEAQGGNPRCGSDVYVDGMQYSIERVEVELSRVPGAPTMPVTQWRRYLTRLI